MELAFWHTVIIAVVFFAIGFGLSYTLVHMKYSFDEEDIEFGEYQKPPLQVVVKEDSNSITVCIQKPYKGGI